MKFQSWVSEHHRARQEVSEGLQHHVQVSPLYFPGSTLSNVKAIELTLPESWRLRFSPWRLRDCRVTRRSPQVSAETDGKASFDCLK